MNILYDTYMKEINILKSNINTRAIILVGSSKDKDFTKGDCKINDIDIFVIVEKQNVDQIRKIKTVNNIEFDINFISIEGSQNFIKNKTYFFLKVKDGNLIYDIDNTGEEIMKLCEEVYNEGPEKLSNKEKIFMLNELKSDILRIREKNNFDDFEYDFLINLYLIKAIKLYFITNDKWLPKDKKLLKSLKKEDCTFYEKVFLVQGESKLEYLLKIVDHLYDYL